MNTTETTKKENLLYDGRILKLFCDDITLPNGEDAKREYVSHSGGVAILPIDEEDNVYFVRQHRYAYHMELLEIPAGKKEYGENPEECGRRELKEEIGATAKVFEKLSEFFPSPGYTNEVIHIYVAKDLKFGELHLDCDEFLNVEKYPMSEAMEMVLSGKIQDGKTIIALLWYQAMEKQGK